MKLKMDVVDVFTHERFKGNAAAVIITKEWLADELMQSIAIENNLSETAYVLQESDSHYQIRWFSPMMEVDFCGHATLAASYVIFSANPELEIIYLFAEAVGEMCIRKTSDGYIQMAFPNRKPWPVDDVPDELLTGLSILPSSVLLNNQAYFAVYEKEEDVLNVRQNRDVLKTLAPYDVVVTAKSTQYDFISRYFWPATGGDEDPVTGSIHAGLAPYWSEQLGKDELRAYQASKRSGMIHCHVSDDRVLVSGQAVHYLEGYIQVSSH